jgi:hypothetical protein
MRPAAGAAIAAGSILKRTGFMVFEFSVAGFAWKSLDKTSH